MLAGERYPDPADDPAYDVLLSLRGWGVAEFERATPEFLDGARYALFAERVVPILKEAEAVLATPLPDHPADKLAAAQRKATAARIVPALRAALYLDEVPGA